MKMYMLDAGGAGIFLLIPVAFLLFLVVWGMLEGWILYLYKFNIYRRAMWHAVLVNLISLVIGFIIVSFSRSYNYDQYIELSADTDSLPAWGMYLVITIIVEALTLKLFYRRQPWGKIFGASIVMNILSYILLYAFVSYAY